jgi:transcriptional regulator with XRE-family HTH domain
MVRMATPQGAFYAALGLAIQKARKAKRITQLRLSRAVNLSRTSITNIERGRQPVPVHLLVQLAHALGLTAADLLPKEDLPTVPESVKKLPAAQQEWVTRVIAPTAPRKDPGDGT